MQFCANQVMVVTFICARGPIDNSGVTIGARLEAREKARTCVNAGVYHTSLVGKNIIIIIIIIIIIKLLLYYYNSTIIIVI